MMLQIVRKDILEIKIYLKQLSLTSKNQIKKLENYRLKLCIIVKIRKKSFLK